VAVAAGGGGGGGGGSAAEAAEEKEEEKEVSCPAQLCPLPPCLHTACPLSLRQINERVLEAGVPVGSAHYVRSWAPSARRGGLWQGLPTAIGA